MFQRKPTPGVEHIKRIKKHVSTVNHSIRSENRLVEGAYTYFHYTTFTDPKDNVDGQIDNKSVSNSVTLLRCQKVKYRFSFKKQYTGFVCLEDVE